MVFLSYWGFYKCNVLPLKLMNAPETFQRFLNSVFYEFFDNFLGVYLDDLLVYSQSLYEHMHYLRLVLGKLWTHKFCSKMSKCEFASPQMEYLGHSISTQGVAPNPNKVLQLSDLHLVMVRMSTFLGITGCYAYFVCNNNDLVVHLVICLRRRVLGNGQSGNSQHLRA